LHRFFSLLLACALVSTTSAFLHPATAAAQTTTVFTDVAPSNVHTDNILIAAQVAITAGCGSGDRFCPGAPVTREQTATFLTRGLKLPVRTVEGVFSDVAPRGVHAPAIEALKRAGITQGCAVDPLRFCPTEELPRAQMATLLANALDLPPATGSSGFNDVPVSHKHRDGIEKLVAAGITQGCQRPGEPARFCPDRSVTREQFASFLARGLELTTKDFGGSTPCPARSGPTTQPVDLGNAIPPTRYGATSAVRTATGIEVFSNGIAPSRSARMDGERLTGTATIPAGDRTWASTYVPGSASGWDEGTVYAGQFNAGGAANVHAFPSAGTGDRTAAPIARVPINNEFWTLTADADGRLYAGSDAHSIISLDPDEHILHRIDVHTNPTDPYVHALRFRVPAPVLDGDGERVRGDIKQLDWHDGELFVGTGQQPGATRLYRLSEPDAEEPVADDITPASLLPTGDDAVGIYSLLVTDRFVVIGSQAATERPARVIVLDRTRPEVVLADVPLDDEGRVDALTVDGDRILAAGFPTGTIYEVLPRQAPADPLLPPTAPPTASATPLGAPVSTATRHLEVDGADIRGVAASGVVWRLASDGKVTETQIADVPGTPAAPGEPQSITSTAAHVVVGDNNAVWVHDQAAPGSTPVPVDLAGEAKAMAAFGRDVLAATYPTGELARIDTANATSELVADWNNHWNRPAAMAVDAANRRVYVLSRHDRETRSSNGQKLYPGALIGIELDADGTAGDIFLEHELTDSSGRFVHGSAVHVLPDGDVVVGDVDGRVQRIAPGASTSTRVRWRHPVGDPPDRATRQIRSLHLEGHRLTVTTAAQPDRELNGTPSQGPSEIRLDARDGRLLSTNSTSKDAYGAAQGPSVLLGPVRVMAQRRQLVAIDRGQDRAVRLARFDTADTFNGDAPVTMAGGCELYLFSGRRLIRYAYDARTRLTPR
jgi:hypothetical protein